MARILDTSTRIIDIDFGGVIQSSTRVASARSASTVTFSQNGASEILASIAATQRLAGSFIQYKRIDLDFMTRNQETMQPVDVTVQRTSPIPLGGNLNGNNVDQIEEYIYVFSRPLNNQFLIDEISDPASITGYLTLNQFRNMGLDGSQSFNGQSTLQGNQAGWPSHAQTIYAEKRVYSNNLGRAATLTNGELVPVPSPAPIINNTLTAMPDLSSITTWGTLNTITGPNLHVYRVVIDYSQEFAFTPVLSFVNEGLGGQGNRQWPPVNISFLCKDPDFTDSEYITKLANVMNSIPEGGPTA